MFDPPQPQSQLEPPTDRATPWRVLDAPQPQPPTQPPTHQPPPTDRATLRRVVGRLVAAAVVVVGLGMFVAWVMLRSGFGVWTTFSVSAWLTVFGALIYTILRMRRDPAMVPAVRTFLVGAFVTTGMVVGSSVIESEWAGQPEQWTAASPGTTAVDSQSGAAIDSGDADPRVVHDEPSRERPQRVDRPGAVDTSVVSEPDESGAAPAETTADEEMSGPDDGDVSSLPVVGNNAPGAPGDDRRRVSTTVPDPAIPPAPGTSSPVPAPTIPPATTTAATSPPTTQPATTQPGTTQPATTQPGTTQPATTQPGTTQPATTQPATTQPATTQPVTTQPATTQPVTTQPATTQPVTTQPATTEPAATEPAATEPAATEPVTTEPAPTEPTTTESTPNLPPHVPPHAGPESGTSEGSD